LPTNVDLISYILPEQITRLDIIYTRLAIIPQIGCGGYGMIFAHGWKEMLAFLNKSHVTAGLTEHPSE
jgi:hypothetical protein